MSHLIEHPDEQILEQLSTFRRAIMEAKVLLKPHPIRKIIVVNDGTERGFSGIALAKEIILVNAKRNKFEKLICLYDLTLYPEEYEELLSRQNEMLDELRNLNIPVTVKKLSTGDIPDEVAEIARRDRVDLIILSCPFKEEPPEEGIISGVPVADLILQKVENPVFLIRRSIKDVGRTLKNILIFVRNFPRYTVEKSIEYAVSLIKPGGKITLFMIVDEELINDIKRLSEDLEIELSDEIIMKAFRQELWPVINALKEKTLEMNVKLKIEFKVGDPVNTIIDHISAKNYGMVVIPSEYREDGRIGAVAEDILRSIKIPSLVVMLNI
ncbi:MAG: universal stress protein [Candidatus Odinarchaeia archaeon]